MPKLSEFDLSAIDRRMLTLREWEAVKQEWRRRAHAERAATVGGLLRRLRSGRK